jgi:M-phase phosphoprotein 6, animal type
MQRAAAAQKVQEKAEVEVETAAQVLAATDGGSGSSAQVRRKWYGDSNFRVFFFFRSS